MRLLCISDFRGDDPRALLNCPRKYCKGFVCNGHDVLPFSYREMMFQLSPLPGKTLSAMLGKRKADQSLWSLARHYRPDMVFLAFYRFLDGETMARLKDIVPNAVIVGWYGDMYPGLDPRVKPVLGYLDWFLATSGGVTLQRYKQAGVPHVAFMPNPCDPAIECPGRVEPRWQSRLLFTGKVQHGRGGQDPLRAELIEHLVGHHGMTVYGDRRVGRGAVLGEDYLNAIRGAEIALSINAYNDVRYYHSDRLIQYLACGAFALVKRVPDSEALFADGEDVCYFDSLEECVALVQRYQQDRSERERIARAGMRRAHEGFHCQRLCRDIVQLIETGEYAEPWVEVL